MSDKRGMKKDHNFVQPANVINANQMTLRWQQLMQCVCYMCVSTDLFIKNTCLTLGNYTRSQNTLSPLENMFHYHIAHSWTDSKSGVTCLKRKKQLLLRQRPRKQHKFAPLVCSSDDITEKQTFLCPAPLVGFLHPHLRGDRRTPGLPLLSNTTRMPPGG